MYSYIHLEPLARFLAEPAGSYVLLEQRTRAVLGVTEAVVQDLENRNTGVEPDEVRERERAHRVVHPELHDLIDRLGAADTLHQGITRLVDHRQQYPVRDESREVVRLNRRLS